MTFKIRQSKVTNPNQSSSNGGRFKYDLSPREFNKVISEIQAPFSDVWIKRFVHNESARAINTSVSLRYQASSANTEVFLKAGEQRDFQSTNNATRYYGIALLEDYTPTSSTSFAVNFDTDVSGMGILQSGDILVFQSPVVDGVHTDNIFERIEIDTVNFTSNSRAEITTVDAIVKNWDALSTVAGEISQALLEATVVNVGETGLTFDIDNVALDNQSTIEQELTFNFTSATQFTVASDDPLITLPNGIISSTYAPINPKTNTAYITILPSAWVTTHNGDSLSLQTHPSAIPIWTIIRFFENEVVGEQLKITSLSVIEF